MNINANGEGAAMSHAITRKPKKKLPTEQIVKTNFLLTCSDSTLASYELAKLSEVANLRSELHALLDHLIDATAQASVARWFRNIDREELKTALETDTDPLEMAKQQIRRAELGADEEEEELAKVLAVDPGKSHRIASLTYQQRNMAEGKCCVCPNSLAPHSVRYCRKHLDMALARYYKKAGGRALPGSVDWLHSDGETRDLHGKQPGTLANLEKYREKRTKELTGERGSGGKGERWPHREKQPAAISAPSGLSERKRGRE